MKKGIHQRQIRNWRHQDISNAVKADLDPGEAIVIESTGSMYIVRSYRTTEEDIALDNGLFLFDISEGRVESTASVINFDGSTPMDTYHLADVDTTSNSLVLNPEDNNTYGAQAGVLNGSFLGDFTIEVTGEELGNYMVIITPGKDVSDLFDIDSDYSIHVYSSGTNLTASEQVLIVDSSYSPGPPIWTDISDKESLQISIEWKTDSSAKMTIYRSNNQYHEVVYSFPGVTESKCRIGAYAYGNYAV